MLEHRKSGEVGKEQRPSITTPNEWHGDNILLIDVCVCIVLALMVDLFHISERGSNTMMRRWIFVASSDAEVMTSDCNCKVGVDHSHKNPSDVTSRICTKLNEAAKKE